MSTLQVHILAGPQAGARLQLNQSPVTFGRSADCTLALDIPVVSRLHGELTLDEQGQWLLTNHSANGTKLGRKKVGKKPLPLTDGASIIIGETEVFRVHLSAASADTADDYDASEEQPPAQPTQRAPGTGMKGRSKLWMGLGIWFALCIGAMIFFATLRTGQDNNGATNPTAGFYYPGREIDDMSGDEAGIFAIRRLLAEPLPVQDPNDSRYSSHIEQANQAFDQGSTGFYQAYRNYQLAITFSDNRDEPLRDQRDVIQRDRVLDELSALIYERYIYAYRAYHESQFEEARNVLDDLRRTYYANNAPDDALANHIRKLRNAAHSKVR